MGRETNGLEEAVGRETDGHEEVVGGDERTGGSFVSVTDLTPINNYSY